MPDTIPAGWGALEYAEHKAREALQGWDSDVPMRPLSRGRMLAETLRKLLAELDAERQVRQP